MTIVRQLSNLRGIYEIVTLSQFIYATFCYNISENINMCLLCNDMLAVTQFLFQS